MAESLDEHVFVIQPALPRQDRATMQSKPDPGRL